MRQTWAGRSVALVLVLLLSIFSGAYAPTALADDQSDTSVGIVQVTNPTQGSGSQFAYRVTFSCNNINASVCGAQPKITIPLDGASGFTKANFNVPTSAALKSWDIVNNELVLTLNDLEPGASDQIGFSLTPPNLTTPNGTTWTWTPKLTFGDGTTPEATASSPVTSKATANAPSFNFGKQAANTAYKTGDTVIYTITAYCSAGTGGTEGLKSITITDPLPSGLTYVSSSNGGVFDGTSVTWSTANGYKPQGCDGTYTGPSSVTVTAKVNSDVAPNTVIKNTASVTASPLTYPQITRSSLAQFTVVDSATKPGNLAKVGFGQLLNGAGDPGSSFAATSNWPTGLYQSGTYPGDWVKDAAISDAHRVRYVAAATYEMNVRYAAQGTQFSLTDPMPCRTNLSGSTYSSAGSCTDPAFNPQVVSVWTYDQSSATSGGLGIPANFTPQALLVDGSVVDLVPAALTGAPAAGANGPREKLWKVPASALGKVVELRFPRTPGMESAGTGIQVGGYADADLVEGNILANVGSVSSFVPDAATSFDTASTAVGHVFIKSLPTIGGWIPSFTGSGGNNLVNIGSYIKSPVPVTEDFHMTVALPPGVTQTGNGSLLISPEQAANGSALPAFQAPYSVVYDATAQRFVARLTISAAKMEELRQAAGGSFNLPTSLPVQLDAPGSYPIEYWTSWAQSQDPVCSYGKRTNDTTNIDGDAATTNGCVWKSTLTWNASPTSDSVRLSKTVKGSLDSSFKSYPAVGTVPDANGSATFRIGWTNQSVSDMKDVTVYDLLPRVGDTGTIAATAKRARGSQFTPTLTSLGAIPAGVTAYYSTSTNPCRPEVLPNANNAGCTDDWTSTAPSDLSTVKALKFVAAGPYSTSKGFNVDVNMSTPAVSSTDVAWNTAASVVTNAQTNIKLAPNETAKVGIGRSDLAHLDVDKSMLVNGAAGSTAKVGDTLTYTVTAYNDGSRTLNNVTLTDTLPAGVTVTNVGGGSFNGSTGTWNVGTLAPGSKVSRVVTVRVDNPTATTGQALENRVTGSSDEKPSVQSANHPCSDDYTYACASVDMAASPKFTIDKSVDKSDAAPGDDVTYTVKVKNVGDAAGTLANVTDFLPAKTTFTSLSGAPNTAGASTSSPTGAGTNLSWSNVSLAPGATQTYTIKAKINANAWGASVDNGAAAKSSTGALATAEHVTCEAGTVSDMKARGFTGESSSASCAVTKVPAAAPGISLTKVPSAPANGVAFVAGETVTYTFTATNTGTVPLENVKLNDSGLTNADGTSMTLTSGPTVSSPDNWDDTLAPGAKATWSATYKVTAEDAASHKVSNVAEVTSEYPASSGLSGDGPKASASGEAVTGKPSVTLTKTADKTSDLKAGDVVTYTYTAKNVGDVDLDGVKLSEGSFTNGAGQDLQLDSAPEVTSPSGFTGSLPKDSEVVWTAKYTVTQADVNAGGPITNSAEVSGQDSGGNTADAAAQAIANPITEATLLSLSKTADKVTGARAGDEVTYTFVATNGGNTTLHDVKLTEGDFTNGAGDTLKLKSGPTLKEPTSFDGTLEPGATVTWTATYVMTEADTVAGGKITNKATATGLTPTNKDLSAGSEATITPGAPTDTGTPEDPDDPATPGNPATPGTPGHPIDPNRPGQPVMPGHRPIVPTHPSGSNGKPSQPNIPVAPSQGDNSGGGQGAIPTGDPGSPVLSMTSMFMGAGLVVGGLILLFLNRRRRPQED